MMEKINVCNAFPHVVTKDERLNFNNMNRKEYKFLNNLIKNTISLKIKSFIR